MDCSEYREALSNERFHECFAILSSKSGDHGRAGTMYLREAWFADDIPEEVPPSSGILSIFRYRDRITEPSDEGCRLRELSMGEILLDANPSPSGTMVVVDILRCLGRFDDALELAESVLTDRSMEDVWWVAEIAVRLIRDRNRSPSIECDPGITAPVRVHEMGLQSGPFESISNGSKTYEMRLYDEKRRELFIGDYIRFSEEGTDRVLLAVVKEILRFDSFKDLYRSIDNHLLGYEGVGDPSDMDVYYSEEKQSEYGVVAIGLHVCNMTDGSKHHPDRKMSG